MSYDPSADEAEAQSGLEALLEGILRELKKIRLHLEKVTEEHITEENFDEEIDP